MPKFRKSVAVPGSYQTPDGPAEVSPARIEHWRDTINEMVGLGIRPPASWGHVSTATPHTADDAAFWASRYNAGHVTGAELSDSGELFLIGEAPGLDMRDGQLVAKVELPGGMQAETAIGEVSIGVRDWTDGTGRVWVDAPIHLALTPLPVIVPPGGQPGFTAVPEAGTSFGLASLLTRFANPEGIDQYTGSSFVHPSPEAKKVIEAAEDAADRKFADKKTARALEHSANAESEGTDRNHQRAAEYHEVAAIAHRDARRSTNNAQAAEYHSGMEKAHDAATELHRSKMTKRFGNAPTTEQPGDESPKKTDGPADPEGGGAGPSAEKCVEMLAKIGLVLPEDTTAANFLERVFTACTAMESAMATETNPTAGAKEDPGTYLSTLRAKDPVVALLIDEKEQRDRAALLADIDACVKSGLPAHRAKAWRQRATEQRFSLGADGRPAASTLRAEVDLAKEILAGTDHGRQLFGHAVREATAPEDDAGDAAARSKKIADEQSRNARLPARAS